MESVCEDTDVIAQNIVVRFDSSNIYSLKNLQWKRHTVFIFGNIDISNTCH